VSAQRSWRSYGECYGTVRGEARGGAEAALRDPYDGVGKPEHLKNMGGNVWYRRVNEVDRLVYEVFDDRVGFLQARYHY
jgi:Uncharacterized protein conserved in bacteria